MKADPKKISLDYTRDNNLTAPGKATLKDRYLAPDEDFQQMFARVAAANADDQEHAQRLYDYMSKLWFMPATPVLTNSGRNVGMPISCFLGSVEDSMKDIRDAWSESVTLGSNGGGLGYYVGNIRSVGEEIKDKGPTSGVIPFVKVFDSLALAVSQANQRRGACAVYIDVSHPEIEEFIEIRNPSGEQSRRSLYLHHGINITDEFMKAVENDEQFNLVSPKDGLTRKTVYARKLWARILDMRMQTGEPYLVFIDTVNREMASHHKKLGLKITQSNLCAEILQPTGYDHLGKPRTAVCCLSSLNAVKYFEWKENEVFIEDVMRFLDNVLQNFIEGATDEGFKNAVYSAMRERSVGLGVMGLHSFYQTLKVPFESVAAKALNTNIFKTVRTKADLASQKLAEERGPCPDAAEVGVNERFSYKMAVAPNATISVICGGVSPSIEPIPANMYTHKTMSGTFNVRNPQLTTLLKEKGKNTEEVWEDILENQGSVQQLDFLSEDEKDIFKTAFELDQRWVIQQAADRAPYIDQSQSVNLFFYAKSQKKEIHKAHLQAWKKGVKTLYYCRSTEVNTVKGFTKAKEPINYAEDECLGCT